MAKKKRIVLVRVVWDDACSIGGAWHELDDLKSCLNPVLTRCVSVGYLVGENKHHIVLAGGLGGSHMKDVQTIPLGCIRHIRRLK